MKVLNLSQILIPNENKDTDVLIKNVSNNIMKINHNTLVFHLNKDIELNIKKFNELKDCYIITDQPLIKDLSINTKQVFHVRDINESYNLFINYYRNLFNIPVVAITGTCGKTTTKEMIKQILENNYTVASTISNKNSLKFNHKYLMSIDDKTDFAVFETAISYPGDLIFGCNFFKPTIGVITNIGIDHLSGCKSIDNYIRTKGEMLAGLNYKGTLIINNDDKNIKKIDFSHYKGKIITFGIYKPSIFLAHNIIYTELGMKFNLKYNNQDYNIFIPGFGEHNVYNALAALAVLCELGIDINDSISKLSSIKHIRSHLEFYHGKNNSILIDDTWSSNPTSMKAALKVLNEKGKNKIKIAVLGKISYLGEFAEKQYKEIAKMIVDYDIDLLITTDSFTKKIGYEAKNYGMKRIIHSKNNNDLQNTLECLLDSNSIVLFKTSMFNQSIITVMKNLIIKKNVPYN